MTLLDVLKLVRHYLKLCVAVMAVCTLLGVVAWFSKGYMGDAEYTAEAVLTASEPTATVSASELMPLVQATANNVIAADEKEGISVSAKYDLASRSVTFTALAESEELGVEAVNAMAWQTAEETQILLNTMAEKYRAQQTEASATEGDGMTIRAAEQDRPSALESVMFTVNDASRATANSGVGTLAKYVLAGLLGGIFLAVFMVVVIDSVKAPLKDREDVEEAFDIPVLAEEVQGNYGQRLWANIQLALNNEPHSVCLIPLEGATAGKVQKALEAAIAQDGLQLGRESEANADSCVSVLACDSLVKNMSALFEARKADAAIVVATRWQDSLQQIKETLRELNVANVDITGMVLLDSDK